MITRKHDHARLNTGWRRVKRAGLQGGMAGFTLLEVLVALTVLALTMAAVIKAAGSYTGNQAYLRDRTLAEWTARNVLAEQQLENAWPRVGEIKGTAEMGKREWRWLATVTQTDEQQLRRLDVEVQPVDGDDDGRPLAVLSGFLEQPTAAH